MKRGKYIFLNDLISFMAFILVVSTGFLLRYILPPGSGRIIGEGSGLKTANRSITLLWGLTRQEWGAIHFWISVILMAILAMHLVFHWRWIIAMFRRQPREGSGIRAGLGLFGLIALAAIAISPFFSATEKTSRGMLQEEHQISAPIQQINNSEVDNESVQGNMSLKEVEAKTGVPVSYLKQKLRLPSDVSPDENIGRLRREYGFSMQDIRKAVAEYKSKRN
jgi:Domain of unknown function (DUF4405)